VVSLLVAWITPTTGDVAQSTRERLVNFVRDSSFASMNTTLRRLLRSGVQPVRKALGIQGVLDRLESMDNRLRQIGGHSSGPGGASVDRGLDASHHFVRFSLPSGVAYELAIDANRPDSYAQQVVHGDVHDATWRLVVGWIRPGEVVLDLGANIGVMSIPAALCGARVHAFELLQDNAQLLAAAARRNGLDGISIILGAVRDQFGFAGIVGHSAWGAVVPESPLTVTALALDDYVSWAGIARVDFIKIDVEGSEMSALRGARQTLARDHPDIVLESNALTCGQNGYSYRELLRVLIDAGYDLYRLLNDRLSPYDPTFAQEVVFADYLATRRSQEEIEARIHTPVVPMTHDALVESIVGQERENDIHKAYVVANRDRLPRAVTEDARVVSLLAKWEHLRSRDFFGALQIGLA